MSQPDYHGESLPVSAKKEFYQHPYIVQVDDLYASLSAEGVVWINQVQEYLVEDLLPHFFQLMKHLGIKGRGPHNSYVKL